MDSTSFKCLKLLFFCSFILEIGDQKSFFKKRKKLLAQKQ